MINASTLKNELESKLCAEVSVFENKKSRRIVIKYGDDKSFEILACDSADKYIISFPNASSFPQEEMSEIGTIILKHATQRMECITGIKQFFIIKNVSIEDLDLSVRSFNCMRREGLTTLHEIAQLSLNQLQAISQLGDRSILEIQNILKEHGINTK